jgi:hypothetical protein
VSQNLAGNGGKVTKSTSIKLKTMPTQKNETTNNAQNTSEKECQRPFSYGAVEELALLEDGFCVAFCWTQARLNTSDG